MRNLTLLSLLLATSAWAAPSTLDLKGQVKFISDAPGERIVGTAEGAGALTLDPADPKSLKGALTVPVAGMKTGNDIRDEHLRSATWLDAAQHPEISFTLESVEVVEQKEKGAIKLAKLKVKGKFKLHGVETPLDAPATLKSKGDKFKLSTEFQIKLADYSIKGKSGVVGDKVGETIDISATFKGELR